MVLKQSYSPHARITGSNFLYFLGLDNQRSKPPKLPARD